MNQKPRFLIYSFEIPYLLKDTEYPIGGAAVESLALARGLIYHGCSVGILTWKGAQEFINRDTDVEIIESYEQNKGIKKVRWLYYRYPFLFNAAKSFSPDYICLIAAGVETGILAHISRGLDIPFIYRIANDMEVDGRICQRLSIVERTLYQYGVRNSRYILTQNEYQYKRLKAAYPSKGIYKSESSFYPLTTQYKNKRDYIAWLGVFQKQKNLPALLHIVKQTPDVLFKIAGTDAKEGLDNDTKNALTALSKCKNVEFVGYLTRKEIINFFSGAHALLNTSYYEGFSNTYLESFQAQTPIISLNSDPNGIIKKYGLGYVTDLQSASNAIKKLINSYDYESGRERMKSYLDNSHDYRTVSKTLLDLLARQKS